MSSNNSKGEVNVNAPAKQIKRYPPRGITLSYQNEILPETAVCHIALQ